MQPDESRSLATTHTVGHISSLRDVLHVIFRRKWESIVFFTMVVVTVSIYSYQAQKIYESTAEVLIKMGRENLSVDSTVIDPNINISQSSQNYINTELDILKSRYIPERVVDKLGPEVFCGRYDKEYPESAVLEGLRYVKTSIQQPEQANTALMVKHEEAIQLIPREDAVEVVMENLTVEVEKFSNIIHLSFQSQNPLLARDTLSSIIDIYQDKHIEIHQAQASPIFFKVQSEKISAELKQKEEELEQFRKEQGIVLIDGQKQSILDLINKLESTVDITKTQISSSQAKIVWLEKTLKERPPTIETRRVTGMSNPTFDNIKTVLTGLQIQEADLKNRYPDDSRILKDLQKQIRIAELELAKEQESLVMVTIGIDTNYQDLQLDLDQERAKFQSELAMKQVLEKEIVQRKTELAELSANEIMLTRLQRDVDITNEEYREYLENFHRSKISAAFDIDKVSNISIVQTPTLPMYPIKPKKLRNIALGIILGFFGSIAIAYSREFLDDSLKTNEDIKKRLGLPVLTTVSLKVK